MDIVRAPQEPWSAPKRVLFRFGFAYLLLYVLPFPLGALPGTTGLGEAFNSIWHRPAQLYATHVLRLPGALATAETGSGDRLEDWCELAVRVCLALSIALVWSILTRASEHRRLHGWLRVYVRYALAATLLNFGWIKIFKSQFPSPPAPRLLETYGESSPMGLLWTFMGFSTAYNVFVGLGEAVPGLLLFFRRTTTLGALLAAAVMSHVAMLNFTFDVPVKILSAHLLSMAIFLAVPDAQRLARLFFLNQPVPSVDLTPSRPETRWRRASLGLKVALVVAIQFNLVGDAWKTWRTLGDGATLHPLEGVWQVEEPINAAVSLPPLASEKPSIRSLTLGAREGKLTFAKLTALDGPPRFLGLKHDAARSVLTLTRAGAPAGELSVQRPDADHLVLQGTLDGGATTLRLTRLNPSGFLLMSRGFHWVTERGFNR